MNIGIIGMGAMGTAIAQQLVKAGHSVCAWSRSEKKAAGVAIVNSPEQAMKGDMTLTLLSDDSAIKEVIIDTGLLYDANPHLIHIVISTISVEFSYELLIHHKNANIDWMAAPVLGRPDVAARGELNILTAGSDDVLHRSQAVLEILSKRIWNMGTSPAAAYAAKIACNMMITMAIEAMAEAVVLTEANGLERERFFDLILNTLFGSRSYQVYSRNIINQVYEPGFKASLGLKDLQLAKQAASESGADLPMLQVVHQQMSRAVEAGGSQKDWSIMADYTLRFSVKRRE
ncbi:TPA: NAD(P)-dependent oxidoreductase [Klebsiella pneumoniae]|nr:NAD(P)-dependent oxidoreductase [Klebsiella pneumoniae]EFH7885961.1 NAD-binding protein [Escherichia coli]EIV7933820.1 NAD(P)-dependent oxidoreductase [Klebsiella pneumoniae]QMC33057.1 NAD(P)-dependent oxidoreductase [Klebsiella pneumoniae]SQY57129.1 3-hydroxyisobutyrate dehydrogenase [Escherichia coli]HBW3482314.1 NAD(P)-dependent oxidoreductase [Klebsiella pneumoniae]